MDDVIEKMDSYGKKDKLASFEDNEEPDSEEEDEDGEEEEDDEEEEEEEERKENDKSADELALEIKGIGLSPNSKHLTDDSKGHVSYQHNQSVNPNQSINIISQSIIIVSQSA